MAEFCGEGCMAICDFCSNFKPDRECNDEQGKCESGVCLATGIQTSRSLGMNCKNFKCFRLAK